MLEEGVNGLSVSEVARRLGVQPPSIYKYFPSLVAVYDALFRRGQHVHLEVMRAAMADATPGLDALTKGLEASGRWALANRARSQSCCSGVPSRASNPRAEAMAPSLEMVAMQRQAFADAVRCRQLGPDADSDEAVYLVSTLITGVLSQAFANEPDLPWGEGRFTPAFPKLMWVLASGLPAARQDTPPLAARCRSSSGGRRRSTIRRFEPSAPANGGSRSGQTRPGSRFSPGSAARDRVLDGANRTAAKPWTAGRHPFS